MFEISIFLLVGMHKSTVCRAIAQVTTAITTRLAHYIGWPNEPEQLEDIATRFLIASELEFGNVCGLVDGTHVNVIPPAEFEAQYVNRHHDHSINAMFVCGPDKEFYFVSAKWPGAVNDSRVLRNSRMYADFEAGQTPFPNAVILGDSIYPTRPWLIPMQKHPPPQLVNYYK